MPEADIDHLTLGTLFRLNGQPVFPALAPGDEFQHHSLPAWDATGKPSVELGCEIESNKVLIAEPSILVSKLNPRKPRVAVVEPRAGERHCASTEFMCFVPRDSKEDLRYWAYYLGSASFSMRLQRAAIGSTNSHTRAAASEVLQWVVPNPPRAQKRAIADVLDTLGITIRQTEAIIAKLKQVKQGLLHDLLTRGIDANGELRPPQSEAPHLYGESPLGWLPKGWGVDFLRSEVDVIDPNPTHRYPLEQREGIPICSTENFEGEDGFELARAKLMPDSVFVAQRARCGFSSDDVVFARKGRIGLARRYGEKAKVFSHTVVILKPKSSAVDRKWLLWLARSTVFLGGVGKRMNSNSGVPTLGVELIGSVLVPFPSVDEQVRINDTLDRASARLHAERINLRVLRQIQIGLMDDLLTGRVRVRPLLA